MRRDGRRNGEERQPRPLASHPSSDGNGAIQEMIAEAFQISPNASPDRYFRESTRARNGHGRHDTHVSHQEELSRHETPHDPLGLEVHTRLKNLELRIAHLETVLFSPRHEERVSANGHTYMTAFGYGEHMSTPGVAPLAIDPSVLASTAKRRQRGSHVSEPSPMPFPAGGMHANQSHASQPHANFEAIKKEDIRRVDLDQFCLPLLAKTAKPSYEQLIQVVRVLQVVYVRVHERCLLSKVREWFRKRREYMAQRISQSCEAYYETTDLSTKRLLRQYLSTLTTDTQAVEDIINMSNLEVTDPVAAHEFCKEKIVGYLNSVYQAHN